MQYGYLEWITRDADEGGLDRAHLFDLDIVAKIRIPVLGDLLRIYVAGPGGASANMPPDAWDEGGGAEWKPTIGWNAGGFAGVGLFPHPRIGIIVEGAWIHRRFTHDIGDDEVEMTLTELLGYAGLGTTY